MSNREPKIIKLSIRTLTPVSIGGDKGEQLSPYADYVFSRDGKMLHFLHLKKLEETVAAQGIIDEYVHAIRSAMDNNRSEFDLEQFITDRLHQSIDDFTARRVLQQGLNPGQRVFITPIVKNAGAPYIPGSSIKGALRTAMLYDWLVNTEQGEPYMNSAAQALGQLAQLRERWFNLKKNRSDFRDIRQVEMEIKKLDRAVFNEDDLFGRLHDGPEARFLRVRDTAPLHQSEMEVQSLRRIRIVPGKGKSTIPQVVEAIPAGTALESEISVLPDFTKPELAYWNKAGTTELLTYLNAFSTACIENEITELSDALEVGSKLDFASEIRRLLKFYEDLKEQCNEGELIIRLGFGKTINDNSLLLAALHGPESSQAWHDMRAAFHKIRRRDDFYPITRLITPGGLPMGWVKVKMLE
ncbi:MAG: type III-A CRISPR-associated RAMP protein Csm5 [Saprospiraceae bacterium]|nr:type III-A CRISPR-associated RAMP protein Csm5 [Saprospiraceae bacterium]